MNGDSERIGEMLIKEGLIDQLQLNEALDRQKIEKFLLGEILVNKGIINDEQLTRVLAKVFNIPFVHLSNIKLDPKVFKIIPLNLMQSYRVLPVSFENNQLTLATNNPLDVAAMQDIQYKTGFKVTLVMSVQSEIDNFLQEYIDSMNSATDLKTLNVETSFEPPIIMLVDSLLRKAIKEDVSDIHIEPQKDKVRVRFRIDGVLYEREPIDKDLERNVISRIKIMSGVDVAETRRPQDGRMSFQNGEDEYDIRISTLPNIYGENLDLRILSKKFANRSFDSLGMDPEDLSVMKTLLNRPYGLILVTGPTGAGKTTTLYSMLQALNDSTRNIITVEDPVEYEVEGVVQTNINNRIGYNFAGSIRHILRHDPDVIMLGEIRDLETAEIAVRAALTGHVVISTMHTNSSAGAITRLLEMDIEPFLISCALSGVIAQRLVRTLCPHCSQEYNPNEAMLQYIKKYADVSDDLKLKKFCGCGNCNFSGYRGRTAVFDLLRVNEDIRKMILKSASEAEIRKTTKELGMKTLEQAGVSKVIQKISTIEEVMKNVLIDQ